ncbi:probable low affinity copper uptake protein 2 [Chrysoperla carnea]|uniref:probable low affinity copper uptake protein 2 n=1 Tax=Chrysoperla carnea TaxID=189513 RepID=UPI001D0913E2|nr:probable low affinity copper uptake protein 2 [Chrysoperla carnea]
MHMWYYWSTDVKNFLFEGYNITSGFGLFATCLMLCAFAIFFEFMKVLKARLRQSELRKRQQNLRSICNNKEEISLMGGRNNVSPVHKYVIFCNEFSLWFFQEIIGYGLMLSVMMYNGYMTIAVGIGAGIGYFLFGQTLLKINKENCAVKKESLCFMTCHENDNAGLIVNAEQNPNSTVNNSIDESMSSQEHIVTVHNHSNMNVA